MNNKSVMPARWSEALFIGGTNEKETIEFVNNAITYNMASLE